MSESSTRAGAPRCVIYARYSSKLQSEKSIEDQVTLCQTLAQREGWEVVEVYADSALSGTSMAPRKALLRLTADAKDGKFDIVLTEGLDRLTRNQVDTAYFYHAMNFVDVKIYSISDGSFVNEMHVGFKGIQHSLFIKDLGQKTRRGQVGTVTKGRISGSVAYGHRLVRSIDVPTGGREIDEEQAVIVRRIFDEWNSGVSVLAIAKQLNKEGIPGADGGLWRPATIFGSEKAGTGILRNELYRGVNKWGKTQTRRTPEGTKVKRKAPESDLLIVDVPYLRIVSDETWFAAKERLESGRALPLHRRKRPKHLLSGLLQCDQCKHGYILLDGKRYGCSGRSALGVCDNSRRVVRAELEKAVLDLVVHSLLEPELLREYIREYEVESRKQAREAIQRIESLRKRAVQVKADLVRLLDALKHPEMAGASIKVVSREINALEAEGDELDVALVEAQSARPQVLDTEEVVKHLRERLPQLRIDLETEGANAARARETFRVLVDRVIIAPYDEGDMRGGGPVSIRVEGKITELIGAGAPDQLCVIPSSASPRAGQNHAIWTLSAIVQSPPYTHSADVRINRLLTTRHDQFLIQQLRDATAPLTATAMARAHLTREGIVATKSLISNWCHKFRMRLHVLRDLGIADTVKLPGKQFQGWVAADRKAELERALPPLESRHEDNPLIFAELNRATRPLTIHDFARAVFRESGETPTPSRRNTVYCRLRACLLRQRKDGKVATANIPGQGAYGWVLAERLSEFSRPPDRAIKTGALDAEILACMASSPTPLTAPEITQRLYDQELRDAKGRIRTWRAIRNLVFTYMREQRRFGNVRPIRVAGKKAQTWEWLMPPVVERDAA